MLYKDTHFSLKRVISADKMLIILPMGIEYIYFVAISAIRLRTISLPLFYLDILLFLLRTLFAEFFCSEYTHPYKSGSILSP